MDGRKKGNNFEHQICRLLSVWMGPKKSDGYYDSCDVENLPFRRRSVSVMPLEGHWSGQGDILHRPSVYCAFAIECKKVEGFELDSFMYSAGVDVWAWWAQACEQAEKVNLEPLLIFSRNHRPVYALMSARIARCLELSPHRGPVLEIRRHNEDPLSLCLLEDLTATRPLGPIALATASARAS